MPSKRIKENVVKIIGERISQARDEKGFSQQKLAELIGHKSRSVVCGMEKGKRPPSLKDLEKLGFALGRKIVWFFDGGTDKDIIHWKARMYDYWEEQIREIFPAITVNNEQDQVFDLLGITHPELRKFLKLVPELSQKKLEEILKPIRDIIS